MIQCVFTHPWKPCEFCLHRNINEPCIKKWGPLKQGKEPILKVIPILGNARLAPEDKLLYQYVFTDEFGKCTMGPWVHEILQYVSVGAHVMSDRLRNAVLYTAAVKLGIQSERDPFGVGILEIRFQPSRRNGHEDCESYFMDHLIKHFFPTLNSLSVHFNDLPSRDETVLSLWNLPLPKGEHPIAFFGDNVLGFWMLLRRMVLSDRRPCCIQF
jgi:hypothetical protein